MEGDQNQYKKGLWTEEEDTILMDYVRVHGKGQWNRIAKKTGLKRSGKSCRLRWVNYLSPSVKRGSFTEEEEDLTIRLHKLLGNRWSLIAGRVPGRTDNQVKNYWNTHLRKKLALRKQKSTVGASAPTSSIVLKASGPPATSTSFNSNVSSYSNSEVITETKTTSNEISTELKAVEAPQQTQEVMMMLGEECANSFWASSEEYEPSNSNLLMELLSGYSFDLANLNGL